MFPVHFFSLSTISWIVFSVPLGSAGLNFSYCMLFWPLPLVASLPCCSILDPDIFSEFYAVKNVRYPQKLCPWIFPCLLRSCHYLPMLVIYPEENFVALKHLFCGTRILVVSSESQNIFLLIPRLITHCKGHWSLVPYRKIWVHFRVEQGIRPVMNPLGSVFQPPECIRCRTPIYLRVWIKYKPTSVFNFFLLKHHFTK